MVNETAGQSRAFRLRAVSRGRKPPRPSGRIVLFGTAGVSWSSDGEACGAEGNSDRLSQPTLAGRHVATRIARAKHVPRPPGFCPAYTDLLEGRGSAA